MLSVKMDWRSKTCHSCVDPALDFLKGVIDILQADYDAIPTENFDGHELKIKSLYTTYRDLRFLKMFFWGMAYQEECSEDDYRLRYVWSNMMRKFTIFAEDFRVKLCSFVDCHDDDDDGHVDNDDDDDGHVVDDDDGWFKEWEAMSYHLRRKIEECKLLVQEICILVLEGAFIKHCHPEDLFHEYGSNTISLVDLILQNLGDLDSDFNLVAPMKQHFEFIERKFKVFAKFANHVSCLACLYWIGSLNPKVFKSELERMVSDLTQKHMPYASGFTVLYFDVFKGTGANRLRVIRRLTVSYVDFLLERLVLPLKVGIILQKGLMFLLSYVMDSSKEDSEEKRLLFAETCGIINEVSFPLCIAETNLSSYLHKIDRVSMNVGELYVLRPLLSEFHFPQPYAIGFLDSLLNNLRTMLEGNVDFTSVRNHIMVVHEELVSLQLLLLHVKLDIENENEWIKNVFNRIAKVVYFAAYVINLCSGSCFFDWYGRTCLPNLIEDIKFVKFEVIEMIDEAQMCSFKSLMLQMDKHVSKLQPAVSNDEAAFIGFDQDVREIRDQLVRGSNNLTIISISGMPGQGKTTLAKRLYNDPSIYYHFHLKVWCYVSKECNPKVFLENAARHVSCNVNDKLTLQDLIEGLWRSLKGKRYLIVLDDIWDVDMWNVVRSAFPNDQNGSRILFTSRNHCLASQAESNSISHPLRPFFEDESRELMKNKLSNCEGFPPEFSKIGEDIADLCKGLPLAIALVAPLLKRAGPVLNLWKQVAENLNAYLAGEGSMTIVELSFKYLPNHLKPCFLYFGAFQRGENVCAGRLMRLWIAEGFVKGNEMQLAEEYLDYLVSQSLLVVTRRSSNGGIKKCRVHHDLLYDLCLEKCVQDNFLHLVDMRTASNTQRYDFHRLCVTRKGPSTLPKPTCSRKEFPTSQIHTVLFNSYSVNSYVPWESLSYFLSNFRVLTVLDLEGLYVDVFPEAVLCNIHLRCLALKGRMEYIPASIVNLWNLETLIVRGEKVIGIPDTLWGIRSLKYVRVIKFCAKSTSMAETCDINVEVLKRVILKYDVETTKFLGRLIRLRKLQCTCWCDDTEVIHPMWFSMFRDLERLESLEVRFPLRYNEMPSVYQQLPAKFNFPDNLKKLSMERGFGFPWSVMSMIGKLPNLKILKMRSNACAGSTWHLGDGEFLKLRFLKLYNIKELDRIDDSRCDDIPFPCLEKLILFWCESLMEIPVSFGDICTLGMIDVSFSDEVKDSVRQIVEQQRDMGNDHLQVFGLSAYEDSDRRWYH